MAKKIYRCPTCKKKLTKEEYYKVLGVIKTNDKELIDKGIAIGTKRQETTIMQLNKDNEKLQKELQHLKLGTSPQTDGFNLETTMTNKLQQCFPDDDIQHHGKRGDILQIVYNIQLPIGRIIFECKQKSTINQAGIKQTYSAKLSRKANYAILITTGKRKKKPFDGFCYENDIFILSPDGVTFFVSVLRDLLISMDKANLTLEERKIRSNNLVAYFTQGEGHKAIEASIHETNVLTEQLKKEMTQNWMWWQERINSINHIKTIGMYLKDSVNFIMSGQNAKIIDYKNNPILPLPNMQLSQPPTYNK